jgi:hypothetical protein
MTSKHLFARAARWCAAGVGAGVGCYAAYVATTWLRYGHAQGPATDEQDTLLDRFMPSYDIVERHRTHVAATAEVTLTAACEMDINASPIVRGIFKTRELLLGSRPDAQRRPTGFLALTKSIGWGVLAEAPRREIVMGAVTQPWQGDVVFRAIPPEQFAMFREPGYVKIAWTLRADPLTDHESVFLTETRAIATDANARRKFRRYWALLSPGIILIRRATLVSVRADAERRARERPAAIITV